MLTRSVQPDAEQADARQATHTTWQDEALRSPEKVTVVVYSILERMLGFSYPQSDLYAVRLAVVEALNNALRHGHRGDQSKIVRIRYLVHATRVIVQITDQGPGFDPTQVPDARLPEGLDKSCGRGLLLMRHYMTDVRFNSWGNTVTLVKCRSTDD